jgi:hypothetical protein
MINMTGFNAMTPNVFLGAIAGTQCADCRCTCSACASCDCSSCGSCSGNSQSVFDSASDVASDIVNFSNYEDGYLASSNTAQA